MMKTLFIPTSTLNFNSIMSSESISPASFYFKRGFGNPRYEKVSTNNLDNVILLYKSFPSFDTNSKEIENFPLVIEVDTLSIPNSDSFREYDEFYSFSDTIYLNPFNTVFYFRNESELINTLSKVEPSIEAKMFPLYQSSLKIVTNSIEQKYYSPINNDDNNFINAHGIDRDVLINKLKGFLISYLIGYNTSASDSIVTLKRLSKELFNTISAVLSGPNDFPNHQQKDQIDALIIDIHKQYEKVEGITSKVDEIVKTRIEGFNLPYESTISFIKQELHYFEAWKEDIKESHRLRSSLLLQNYSFDKTNNKIELLDKYILQLNYQISQIENNLKHPNINSSLMPIITDDQISYIPSQKEFILKLFNEYLKNEYSRDSFTQSRYNFAIKGGKIFSEELKEKWANSASRTYINSLLKNLNEYTAFDINSIDNPTLKSFAAFCQKGDSDIEKLQSYLVSCGIGDTKISLSIWGLIFGFAEMPKTFTKTFFESDDKDYISEMYKYIFEQLHGIKLTGSLPNNDYSTIMHKSYPIKMNNDNGHDKSDIMVSDSRDLSMIFDYEEFKSLTKPAINFYKNKLAELYSGHIDAPFINSIEHLEYKKTYQKLWIKVIDHIKQDYLPNKNSEYSLPLFQNNVANVKPSFYCDKTISSYLEDVLPKDKKVQKQFLEDLNWFQDNYNQTYNDKKKGAIKGYYFDRPKDNNSVIDNFKTYLENKRNNTNPKVRWLSDIYKKIKIDEIISKLRRLYSKESKSQDNG